MAQGEIDENNQILGDEALAIYLQKIEEAKYAKQQQIYENNSNALMLQHHNYMNGDYHMAQEFPQDPALWAQINGLESSKPKEMNAFKDNKYDETDWRSSHFKITNLDNTAPQFIKYNNHPSKIAKPTLSGSQKCNPNPRITNQLKNKIIYADMDDYDECKWICISVNKTTQFNHKIIQYLTPQDRIKCCQISKQFKNIIQDPINKTIFWNDTRMFIKRATDENNKSWTLKFIHQSRYPKSYKNCIEISITNRRDSLPLDDLWIMKSIPNIERFGSDAYRLIYTQHWIKNFIFLSQIYLELDCKYIITNDANFNFTKNLFEKTPNLMYLSILNAKTSGSGLFVNMAKYLKSLKYLQFTDCRQSTFIVGDKLKCYGILRNIIALDLSFCEFRHGDHIQQIMDQLVKLKYLSFVSNGVVTYPWDDIILPSSIKYLRYVSECPAINRYNIYLDLSEIKSLEFIECFIDEVMFLNGISQYCLKSATVRYISFLYEKPSIKSFNADDHWSKRYRIFENEVKDLKISVTINGQHENYADRQVIEILEYFLERSFKFDSKDIASRAELMSNFLNTKAIRKLTDATTFFEWG